MIKDGKDKKFDTILAIKLDRISRSVYDMEVINKMLSDNELDLICIFESFDTTNANGRMVQRIMTSVAQNEIERTSERTKIGMAGAIKAGHIPGKTPAGYRRENKCLVVDPITSLVVKKIFEMYSRGNSQFIIAQELTKEHALGKKEYLCRNHNIEEKIIKKKFNWFIITNLLIIAIIIIISLYSFSYIYKSVQ